MDAAFEFFTKLGVGFWCFHDRDIAPEAIDLAETNKRLDTIVAQAKKLQADTAETDSNQDRDGKDQQNQNQGQGPHDQRDATTGKSDHNQNQIATGIEN